jgi:uncharacterized cupin superfamily protein
VNSGVTLAKLDPDAHEQRFRRLRRDLGVTSFGINLLVMEPRQRSRIHRHEHQEEVYLVIAGELTLLVDGGDEHTLGVGDLARVAPDVRRQLVNRGDTRLELLALGGHGEHEGRDGRAYHSWDEQGEGHSPADVPFPDDE